MAMTSGALDDASHAAAGGSRIAIAGDRGAAFRSAARHSLMVRTLRWGLPLGCLGIMGVYGVEVMRTSGWGSKLQQLTIPKVDPLNLTMENPKYEGYNKDGGRYVVVSDKARQDLGNLGHFKLEGIRGRLLQPDNSTTDLIAKRGSYDSKTSAIELLERIKVTGSNGLVAHLTQALVETKEDRITSVQPVEVELPTANVKARRMTLLNKQRQVTFTDQVRTHLIQPPRTPAAGTAENAAAVAAAAKAAGAPSLLGGGSGPVDIDSRQLQIDDQKKTALFTGNVVAVQADSTLRTPELLVTYEAGQGATPGPAPTPGQPQQGGHIDRITAKGPVAMTRAGRDEVTSDAMEYDGRSEIVTLTGNVVMTQQPDKRVTAARADYDSRGDTVLLTGGVDVVAGRNELHGRRMFVDNKAGRTQLSSPAEPGRGAGRVSTRFYRGAPEAAAGAAAAAAAKAPKPEAESEANPMAGKFATNPSAPIEVQSATLDVDDHAKAATFRGDVVAAQGDLNIKSGEMIVRYAGSAGVSSTTGAPGMAAAPDPAGGAQIIRIEARRKVVVGSKDGQTATGDWANFDAKTNNIELGGDVVMTQGQNIVRGTRLMIDMVTGESRIITTPQEGWVARAAKPGAAPVAAPLPPGAPAFKGDRPSAVFFPKQMKDKAATGAANAGAAAGAAGAAVGEAWGTKTQPAPVRTAP